MTNIPIKKEQNLLIRAPREEVRGLVQTTLRGAVLFGKRSTPSLQAGLQGGKGDLGQATKQQTPVVPLPEMCLT